MLFCGSLPFAVEMLEEIGLHFGIRCQKSASGYVTKPEFLFIKDTKPKAVVEAKSPGVFKTLVDNLLSMHEAFEVRLQSGATTIAERAINQVSHVYPL